jgi:hypothetical protein
MNPLPSPPVLNYSSAAPVPRSFFATTVGILRNPPLAFHWEADPSYAYRFARIHTLIASLMLGIGAHLYIAYLSRLELFGSTTGHWSDGWFWIPLSIFWYVLFALASRIAQRHLARQGTSAESQAAAAHRRTSVLLHCAQLLPPAVTILSTILILYRLDYSFTISASEPPYLILLIFELIMGAAYLVLTFKIASRTRSAPAEGE